MQCAIYMLIYHFEISYQLMAEKEDLLSSCKDLIEIIKDKDKSLAADIRDVYRQADEDIANLRKQFKNGYEERLSKVTILLISL